MFNVNTAVSTEQELVSSWCEQVRSIHAEEARPVQAGDPRMTKLSAANPEWAPESGYNAELLGWLYFTKLSKLPAWPLPAPEWAVRTRILVGAYPEIDVEHSGRDWAAGTAAARICQYDSVSVEGGGHEAGKPSIETTSAHGYLAGVEALNLSTVLGAAAHEFTSKIGAVAE